MEQQQREDVQRVLALMNAGITGTPAKHEQEQTQEPQVQPVLVTPPLLREEQEVKGTDENPLMGLMAVAEGFF